MTKKIKLSVRLFGGFGLIVLMTVIISILSYSSLSSYKKSVEIVNQTTSKKIILLHDMQNIVNRYGKELRNLSILKEERISKQSLDNLIELRTTLEKNIEMIKEFPESPSEKKLSDSISDLAREAFVSWDTAESIIKEGRQAEAGIFIVNRLSVINQKLIDKIGQKYSDEIKNSETTFKSISDSISGSLFSILFFTLVSIVLSVVLTSMISKSIIDPINLLINYFDNLSKSKFDNKVDLSYENEFGQIFQYFMVTQDKLKETFENISKLYKELIKSRALVVQIGISPPFMEAKRLPKIKQIAEKHGVLYISESMKNMWNNPRYMSDAVHPNDLGYSLLCSRVIKAMQKHYKF